MSDQLIRAVRDYVRGSHASDWTAVLTRLKDASESDEHKVFGDEVLAVIAKNKNNPAKAKTEVRALLKRHGVPV